MKRLLFLALLVPVFFANPAGRNFLPRIAVTNSVDQSLVVQLLADNGASSYGNGNPVTVWSDAGIYSNHATNVGIARPVYIEDVYSTGKAGVFFDGTNNMLKFPISATMDITSDFTILAWLYKTNADATIFMGGYQQTGGFNGYGFGIGIIIASRPSVWTDTTGNWRLDGNTVPVNTWTHIGVKVTGGNCTFYYNGVQASVDACAAPSSSSVQRVLGADTAGLYQYGGFMGDFRIYNRALSTTEVNAIYTANLR